MAVGLSVYDKREFGKQFAKCRKETGLIQGEYAKYKGMDRSYISKLENGKVNIQVDTMEENAATFGVTYCQMGNPIFPVPALERIPVEIQRVFGSGSKST